MSLEFPKILRSNFAGVAITLVLAAILAAKSLADFPYQFGIDFYHFWGVPLVKQKTSTARSPYVDPDGYARVLNQLTAASGDHKLSYANHFRRKIEPTATPFFYTALAFLPADYQAAQALFAIIQYLAAGLGVYLLLRLRDLSRWPAIWIALLTELSFNPFVLDIKFGNVNSLQLAFLATVLHVAVRKRYSGKVMVDGLFIALLAVFVIFKPNTLWIAAALALHYWLVRGARCFLVGAALAVLLGGLAIAYGAWYFKHLSVWLEWLHYVRGIGSIALPFNFEHGNQSLTMLLAQLAMSYGPTGYGVLIALSMLVALIATMTANGRAPSRLGTALRKSFADPWCAASLGVLFTFATSPLVWPYYHLFALLPIFWLVGNAEHSNKAAWGAVICYGALSRPVIDVLLAGECYGVLRVTMLLAWLPLIPGVFLYGASSQRSCAAKARAPA